MPNYFVTLNVCLRKHIYNLVHHFEYETEIFLPQVGFDKADGAVRVKINPRYYRPTEVEFLLGDATKAKKVLGWEPKIKFEELVKDMVEADIAVMKRSPNA